MAQMVSSKSIILTSVGLPRNSVWLCSFNVMDAEKALFSVMVSQMPPMKL